MKKTVTALALGAILIPAAVFAGSHFSEQRQEHRLERMTEHLQLTTQQQTEVRRIMDEQQDKRRALHDETRQRIAAVLTGEQRTKAQALREQRRKGFCDHHGKHPHGEGMAPRQAG